MDMITDDLSLEDIERFTVLGCLIAQKGSGGEITLSENTVTTFLKCKKLPEKFIKDFHLREAKSDNGEITASFAHWYKYQMDSTGYERVKKHRKGKNDNGTREDKTRQEKDKTRQELKDLSHFENLWEKYPSKVGKKNALRHHTASVLTEQDMTDIELALSRYVESERVRSGYVMNGSTWFNNWRDWIDYVDPKDVIAEQGKQKEAAAIAERERKAEAEKAEYAKEADDMDAFFRGLSGEDYTKKRAEAVAVMKDLPEMGAKMLIEFKMWEMENERNATQD